MQPIYLRLKPLQPIEGMLEVGVDGQIFAMHRHGGISRYFATLLSSPTNQDSRVAFKPLFRRHLNEYLKRESIGLYCEDETTNHLLSGAMHLDKNKQLTKYQHFDIYHATYYLGAPPPKNSKKAPLVSTLHDMTPENIPSFFPRGNPHQNKIKWLQDSDLIISVSETSASDLIERHPELSPRIRVIHHGIMPQCLSKGNINTPNELGKKPFFLYIGSRSGYKNARLILRAYLRVGERVGAHHLLFAGGGPLTTEERQLVQSSPLRSRIHTCQPDDSMLLQLYQNASIVLVPSLAEGFSYPLIESLYCDAKVACSNISVHREVASDFAHFASPTDIETWCDLLEQPSALKKPSELLGCNYQAHLKYYHKDRMLKEHFSAYQELTAITAS